MRVGSFSLFDQLAGYMDQDLSTISGLQQQLSSGKKMSKNSDDVIGVISAMDYNLELNQDSRYIKNIDNADTLLGNASSAMSSTFDALNNAKEMALQGLNGTSSSMDMATLAKQVYSLRDELLGYANTKTAGGQSVFAGFQTQTAAYDSSKYVYQGDLGIVNTQVSGSGVVAVNVPGSTAFSYTLSGPVTIQQADGTSVTYSMDSYPPPAGDTTIYVKIEDGGGNVLESTSFSNFIQLTNNLGDALSSGDTRMVSALLTPLDDAINQTVSVSSDIGARQSRLANEKNSASGDQANAQILLSGVQDDNIADTTTQLAKYQAALQAIRESTANVISQSLLDFLK